MTAILIEDEPLAAKELEMILGEVEPDLQIVVRLDSVRDSVKWLKANQADLIFSDIHLGDGQCFEIFRQAEVKTPVIFITAYDEYALQAFKSQGIDYILKPFDKTDICQALNKVKQWLGQEKTSFSEEENLMYQERFLVQMGAYIKSVPVNEIAYFMADGKYLMLYTFEGNGYVVDQTMGGLESRLDPKRFFRINRKFILSYPSIKEMVRYSNSRIKIILYPPAPEGIETIVSSERIKEFKKWLNH